MVEVDFHTNAAWLPALVLLGGLLLGCADAGDRSGGEEEHHQRRAIPTSETLAGLPPDGGDEWNRLVFEKSPYLLQHAANPVDWYPWGDEAFERARAEGKPVFLSIGYSTCHWCHVMEKESFENDSTAAIMNEYFVCIKVDREERPDVDNIYMAAVMAMSGRGGWPLSAFLTPEGKPFFAATYLPPEDRYGMTGFPSLLVKIHEEWTTDRERIVGHGDEVARRLRAAAKRSGPGEVGPATLEKGAAGFARRYDSVHGGFGDSPKFPSSHNLSFLLRHWKRSGDARALEIVEKTLDEMARGGMADQIGGGFHRSSTDRQWLVPHFEKMLYDQAMLAITYIEAYQATGREQYADVARGIFTYVLRDMTAPGGGFYSAEDADSEGEEGVFYVWKPDEVRAVLGEEAGDRFCAVYGLTESGNFERGSSILHLKKSLDEAAAAMGVDPEGLKTEMADSREKLLETRSKRIRPLRDDKVITAWNGMMITAFALGARALDDGEYALAAERAAAFALEKLRNGEGRVLRRWRDGEASCLGYIDDYAWLVHAMIDLYETTFDPVYVERANELAADMWNLFWDDEGRGFFFAGSDGEKLLVRSKEIYDGAFPSGNSIAALALLRLGDITGDPETARRGRASIEAFSGELSSSPAAHAQMLSALDFAVGPTVEVVVAGEEGSDDTEAMLRELRGRFLPNAAVLFRPEGGRGDKLASLAPYTAEQRAVDGRATAYVCRNHACSLPTHDAGEMVRLVEGDE